MTPKTFLLCAILAIAAFTVSADDVEPLYLENYTMTRDAYLQYTGDTQFGDDFLAFNLSVYNLVYTVTSRVRKFSSGNLTFTFDANQTVDGTFGPSDKTVSNIQASVEIALNKVTNIILPDVGDVSAEGVKKIVKAYIEYVAVSQVNYRIVLTEQYVDHDLLRTWNPTYAYKSALVPDIQLRLFNFSSDLRPSQGVTGAITLNFDAYSRFMSYTPRFRGKTLALMASQVGIIIRGDPENPTILLDSGNIRPFPERDIIEIITAYYLNVCLPRIRDLFA